MILTGDHVAVSAMQLIYAERYEVYRSLYPDACRLHLSGYCMSNQVDDMPIARYSPGKDL